MRQEIESISFFQSLMMEENTVSSGKKNKNKKEEKKKTKNLLFWGIGANNSFINFFCDAGLIDM